MGGPNTHTANPRWQIAAILKTVILPYLGNIRRISIKFGTVMHIAIMNVAMAAYKLCLLFVIKETSLKQQISQFYLQILSSEKLAFRFVTGH